jgi:hypothetical protein
MSVIYRNQDNAYFQAASGSGTAADPFVPSAGALAAGSAVIGKVGIDQTTPGTTNLVQVLGSQPAIIKGSLNNGQTAYASGNLCVGGIFAIPTGAQAGAVITGGTFKLEALFADVTTLAANSLLTFDANPTGSTFTDNTTAAIVAADLSKVGTSVISSSWTANAATYLSQVFTLERQIVGASGNVWAAVICVTATQVFRATNVLKWQAKLLF